MRVLADADGELQEQFGVVDDIQKDQIHHQHLATTNKSGMYLHANVVCTFMLIWYVPSCQCAVRKPSSLVFFDNYFNIKFMIFGYFFRLV